MLDYVERFVSNAIAGDGLSMFVLLMVVSVLSGGLGLVINHTLQAILRFCGVYPLHIFERIHCDCHATWLKGGGILLTSRASGRTVSEIQFADVHTVLLRRGGLGGRFCLRFSYRLNEVPR